MTCIAAVVGEDGSFIAGERGVSSDDCMMLIDTPKVWKSGEYLFGYYGGMEGLRFKENFIPPKIPAGVDIIKFMNTVFSGTGKRISSSLIRKIVLSSIYPVEKMKTLSHIMGHSIKTAVDDYVKS